MARTKMVPRRFIDRRISPERVRQVMREAAQVQSDLRREAEERQAKYDTLRRHVGLATEEELLADAEKEHAGVFAEEERAQQEEQEQEQQEQEEAEQVMYNAFVDDFEKRFQTSSSLSPKVKVEYEPEPEPEPEPELLRTPPRRHVVREVSFERPYYSAGDAMSMRRRLLFDTPLRAPRKIRRRVPYTSSNARVRRVSRKLQFRSTPIMIEEEEQDEQEQEEHEDEPLQFALELYVKYSPSKTRNGKVYSLQRLHSIVGKKRA